MRRTILIAMAAVGALNTLVLTANSASAQYGPDTCRTGYVWREAYRGDHVCVRPWVRAQAARDNERTDYRYRYR